ncbi:hypothetical protein ACLOJK_038123 [Asimina triloba]
MIRLDYEVAELTWENGQLAMHGLGPPRTTTSRPPPKFAWEKPRASGTLESIVDQATCVPADKAMEEIVPWFEGHQRADASLPMDALVPCSHRPEQEHSNRVPGHLRGGDFSGIGSWVGSCSGVAGKGKNAEAAAAETAARKRARSSQNQSVSGSETLGRESQHVTVDTSTGSHENTSSRKPMDSRTQTMSIDEHDSVSHSRPQACFSLSLSLLRNLNLSILILMGFVKKEIGSEDERKGKAGRSSVSSKRSRAAAIHNQSERKRRDRINQRMKTLQKLVPNSSKTDKASMLDEVIDYLKQLQAQVQMMAKMSSTPQMMMPVAMQQQLQLQLQMSMMAQMGMSMGMGMGVMDMHSMNRPATATAVAPMIHPAAAAAFLPMAASWDASADRLQAAAGILPDPFAAFLACQAQDGSSVPAAASIHRPHLQDLGIGTTAPGFQPRDEDAHRAARVWSLRFYASADGRVRSEPSISWSPTLIDQGRPGNGAI